MSDPTKTVTLCPLKTLQQNCCIIESPNCNSTLCFKNVWATSFCVIYSGVDHRWAGLLFVNCSAGEEHLLVCLNRNGSMFQTRSVAALFAIWPADLVYIFVTNFKAFDTILSQNLWNPNTIIW